ncbi:MAG: hypothetical protein JWP06_599 [Candidatus Saccharibacteria bacterium]|nr:hypothetical protein [Candidatus Saccharibacteria bacterium]
MQRLIDTLINDPARYTHEHNFAPGWALAFVIGALLFEIGLFRLLIYLLIKIFQYRKAYLSFILRRLRADTKEAKYTFLQLTFPTDDTRSAHATEQLHILLSSTIGYDGLWDRLTAPKQPYSLEIAATKNEGIRYIIRIPDQKVETTRRTLLAFLPGLKIRKISDYLSIINKIEWGVVELKLSSDFVLPLADRKTLNEHDIIAYLTGHMRSLTQEELVALQIVAVPIRDDTHPNELRHIREIRRYLNFNKEITPRLTTYKINIPRLLLQVAFGPLSLIISGVKIIISIFVGFSTNILRNDIKEKYTRNSYDKKLGQTIETKLDQHLFEVCVRLLVISPNAESIRIRLNALQSSFNVFTTIDQSMIKRKKNLFSSSNRLLDRFNNRELLLNISTQQTILSTAEISNFYHFPDPRLTKTDGLVKSRSRELAAPLSIRQSDTKLDVVVGMNVFDDQIQEIGITLEQRQKHTYIIGKTGTGKTTLLKNSIHQDMLNNKGLAVLDPHGDMFHELLDCIPENRRKDVVVFDPSDRDYPIGLNILDPGIGFASKDEKNEWITSAVLSIFTKLADEKQWGPRMEHILRNATLTALQIPKPSLYTLQQLLTDRVYQKEIAKTLKDPVLKQFWNKEFKLMGSMQMSAATAPLTNRLGHFITSKMSRHILLQEESTIRIADIINGGKILLVNLSKGDIGEDQSEFFGTILTTLIWMAAYQRTKIPEKKRRDFFVYVDEFQNFATPQFGAITSEGRKFHVSLIVSHQNIAQIEDKDLMKVIAGNAATIICLKANPEDESFILPYMRPEVRKGDIVNLAPYHFYMKTSGNESEDAFSGQTVPFTTKESKDAGREVVLLSQKKYGTTKHDIETYMDELFRSDESNKSKATVSVEKRANRGSPRELHTG